MEASKKKMDKIVYDYYSDLLNKGAFFLFFERKWDGCVVLRSSFQKPTCSVVGDELNNTWSGDDNSETPELLSSSRHQHAGMVVHTLSVRR